MAPNPFIHYSFTIPLLKKLVIHDLNQKFTNIDLEFVVRMLGQANQLGLLNKKVTFLSIDETDDGKSVTFTLKFDDQNTEFHKTHTKDG